MPDQLSEVARRAGDAAKSFGGFVWHDLKATLRAFAKVGGAALVAGTVALFVTALLSAQRPQSSSPALTYAVWLAMCAYYAAIPAAAFGAVAATWRHFGWTTLLPLLTLPLATWGAFSLGGSLVANAAGALAAAFLTAAHAYNWPAVHAFGRLAHAGPVAVPFVLAAALFDGAHLLGDARVLGALLRLALVLATLAAASALLAVGVTAPPMAWVFVRRARVRWAAWRDAAR